MWRSVRAERVVLAGGLLIAAGLRVEAQTNVVQTKALPSYPGTLKLADGKERKFTNLAGVLTIYTDGPYYRTLGELTLGTGGNWCAGNPYNPDDRPVPIFVQLDKLSKLKATFDGTKKQVIYQVTPVRGTAFRLECPYASKIDFFFDDSILAVRLETSDFEIILDSPPSNEPAKKRQ